MERPFMPSPLTAKSKKTKAPTRSKKTLADKYAHFFTPRPSPLWPTDDVNFSLDQPSPLQVVPSETTYGFPVPCELSQTLNA
jgi:hypothetical protein